MKIFNNLHFRLLTIVLIILLTIPISQAHTQVVASDNTKTSDDTLRSVSTYQYPDPEDERDVCGAAWTEATHIHIPSTLGDITGTVRLTFQFNTSRSGYAAYVSVKKDGVEIASNSTTSTTMQTHTQDISISLTTTNEVEIWLLPTCYGSGSSPTYAREQNFQLKYDRENEITYNSNSIADNAKTSTDPKINYTIYTNDDLSSFKFNFNDVDYNVYNSDLVLGLNLNNNANVGENATHTFDISSSHNNGTISGATWTTSGKYGKALSFDGTNDIINITANSGLNITTAITISAWIKKNVDDTQMGIANKEWCNNGIGWALESQNTNKIRFATWASTASLYSTNTITGTSWNHVVATYDNSTYKIYINGILDSSVASTGAIGTNTCDLQIGFSKLTGDTASYWNGDIDEFRVYKRALSPTEISYLYDSELQKYDNNNWFYNVTVTNLNPGDYDYMGSITVSSTYNSAVRTVQRLYNQLLYNTNWQDIFVNKTTTLSGIKTQFNSSNVQWVAIFNPITSMYEVYKNGLTYQQNTTVKGGQAVKLWLTNNDTTIRYPTNPNSIPPQPETFYWDLTGSVEGTWNFMGLEYNGVKTLSQINTSINNLGTCDATNIVYYNRLNGTEYSYTCSAGTGQTNASVQVGIYDGFWVNSTTTKNVTRTWS